MEKGAGSLDGLWPTSDNVCGLPMMIRLNRLVLPRRFGSLALDEGDAIDGRARGALEWGAGAVFEAVWGRRR